MNRYRLDNLIEAALSPAGRENIGLAVIVVSCIAGIVLASRA